MSQRRQRSGLILGLVALCLLAGVALTASPAQAASGPGPYFAEPAWDRNMVTSNRFLILTNWNSEAVLDKETGLVWERSPEAIDHTWSEARSQCVTRTTGNRIGWRLPSVHELESLIDPSVAFPGPALPPGHPFLNVRSGAYWSATSFAFEPSFAWLANFLGGNLPRALKTTGDAPAWCVRGGMNADQY
jgi:hypothetical protein